MMTMKSLQVNLQKNGSFDGIPTLKQFQSWIKVALEKKNLHGEITVRITSPEEIQQLNRQYRHKDKPTNILSFNYSDTDDELIGDLVICDAVVKNEAKEQQKTIEEHYAHLTIHGMLHLRGYDHETSEEAEEMEALEIALLASLSFPNPYLIKAENSASPSKEV